GVRVHRSRELAGTINSCTQWTAYVACAKAEARGGSDKCRELAILVCSPDHFNGTKAQELVQFTRTRDLRQAAPGRLCKCRTCGEDEANANQPVRRSHRQKRVRTAP